MISGRLGIGTWVRLAHFAVVSLAELGELTLSEYTARVVAVRRENA